MERQWTQSNRTWWLCREVGGHLHGPAWTRCALLGGISAQRSECRWNWKLNVCTLMLLLLFGGLAHGVFMATFKPSILIKANIIVEKPFYPVAIFTFPETTISSSDLIHHFPQINSTRTNNSRPSDAQKTWFVHGYTSIKVDTIPGCTCGKFLESLPGILWTRACINT